MRHSTFSLLSCTVLALLASSALAQGLSPPATPLGGSTSFAYYTQDLCSRTAPGSKLGTTIDSNGNPSCSCLSPENPGKECSDQGLPPAGQKICLEASTWSSAEKRLSATARCGVCSRRAGSPGARSIFCQDIFARGVTVAAATCGQGRKLWYTKENGCSCSATAAEAGAGAKVCPRPKANGSEAYCRTIFEDFTDGETLQYESPITGCHMRCSSGFHESPAEKPVTCCKSGFRSNASGVCAKSTDGKQ